MLTAEAVLDKEFLEIRCQLIEIAASLDRLDRAAEFQQRSFDDPRLRQLYESLRLLADRDRSNRSEELLLLFSDK
jgi:hypothetical protein